MPPIREFWSLAPSQLMENLGTGENGLSVEAAEERKAPQKGKNRSQFVSDLLLFLSQFKSPLVLLLVFSLILSSVLGEISNSVIIFVILFLTGILGFFQERNAGRAVEKLRNMVSANATVIRGGDPVLVNAGDVVPGDILLLDAGDIVPGDGLILSSKDLYTNETVLTGESFPAEKTAATVPADAPVSARKNSVFRGTSVVSGTAKVIVAATGKDTELGGIEKEMGVVTAETAFEKGVRNFGYLLMRVSLVLAGTILIVNLVLGRPVAESILFALAISIGLTPELLPSILTITLSAGARRLAKKKVIVRKLASIQNLGAINVLCSDKTGTLTEGEVKIHSMTDADGKNNPKIGLYALLNAKFESGFTNPMDEAIRVNIKEDVSAYEKLDEVPYDFIRKRLSVVVKHDHERVMITKGALSAVLNVCTQAEREDGTVVPIDEAITAKINGMYREFSAQG
ncbi:MAG TPA: HAD-IC family P-type ATPase, partial [Bacteroidia bacterium]|nr:HAD-IC family P-type ATPase [Bacteroidia bacterium]